MKPGLSFILIAAPLVLMSCEGLGGNRNDTTRDHGIDSKHLSELQAGIWIDPNGCDHWIVDDGLEGYLSQRLDRRGKPVCSGTAFAETAIGDFKIGSSVNDPI